MKPKVIYKQLKPPATEREAYLEHVSQQENARKYYRCALIFAVLITLLCSLLASQLLFFPFFFSTSQLETVTFLSQDNRCDDQCTFVLVESIPEGLVYDDNVTINPSVFQSWSDLIHQAKSSVDIASFYWTLTNNDTHTYAASANQGEEILQELMKLKQKGVSLRIAVDPSGSKKEDITLLQNSGAEIRIVNLPNLTGGILHTKFWVVDNKHLYLGSANMDWRSLTQVKELGATVYNCSCLAQDLGKIFEVYWSLGVSNTTIPSPWPANYSTSYNETSPLEVTLNNTASQVYISSSPPPLSPTGRTDDIRSILSIIDDAKKFIYISVMDYTPTEEYSHPKRFWPEIDDHLRKAVYEKRINVRLLISCWKNSNPAMFPFLTSLAALNSTKSHYNIEVKIFVVPATPEQKKIPFARVNHNKYMVTDRVAYIGTSNWAGDYFIRTAGAAIVVNQTSSTNTSDNIQNQLRAVFDRDWNSNYSRPLHTLKSWKQCNF
ncbi:5'-3' exonuclease PLD3 [Bombina bombina]|uniref:5'-3' exonuclease PLD3 n=1 Tax=Bombina bombina TaxID=8345 RepID=UPI00235AE359|nr:5'-3' exonuclease PLD3 [Bombina bombina]